MLWIELVKAEIAKSLIGIAIGGVVLLILWILNR